MDRIRRVARHILPLEAKCAASAVATDPLGEVSAEVLSGIGTKVVEDPSAISRTKRNWGGQIVWGAARTVVPTSIEELCAAVHDCKTNLRVVGRGHSFSPICEVAGGTLVSLIRLNKIIDYVPPSEANSFAGTVRFEAGATFSEICHFLAEQPVPTSLKQIPSPLFVTIAGALATGTHGSGINTKAIAAHVQDIEFVTADGSLVRYVRGPSGPSVVTAENVAGGHVGCLGVVSRMSLDVVPYCEGHNFWLYMSIEKLLQHWDSLTGDLHLGGSRRPLVDSHSILVSWKKGVCVLNAKHLYPHYNPDVAAKPAAWGEHPFGSTRWRLITPWADTLSETLANAGVVTDASNVVTEVAPHSMAAEAGVAVGWVLTQIGSKKLGGQLRGKRSGTRAEAEAAFREDRGVKGAGHFHVPPPEGDTSMIGASVKLPLLFEHPTAEHESIEAMFPGVPPINHAYRGPWHDTLPAWALGQPLEDGPECDCGQQSEFFVPMENAVPALRTAWEVMKHWSTASFLDLSRGCFVLSELRSIKGCDGWVSCTPRDTMSIHLSWSPSPKVQGEIWREIIKLEKALAPLGARPHWGKIYTASFWAPRFPELYKDGNGGDLQRFRELAKVHDPQGKFQNRWTKETMFAGID